MQRPFTYTTADASLPAYTAVHPVRTFPLHTAPPRKLDTVVHGAGWLRWTPVMDEHGTLAFISADTHTHLDAYCSVSPTTTTGRMGSLGFPLPACAFLAHFAFASTLLQLITLGPATAPAWVTGTPSTRVPPARCGWDGTFRPDGTGGTSRTGYHGCRRTYGDHADWTPSTPPHLPAGGTPKAHTAFHLPPDTGVYQHTATPRRCYTIPTHYPTLTHYHTDGADDELDYHACAWRTFLPPWVTWWWWVQTRLLTTPTLPPTHTVRFPLPGHS